MSENKNLIKSSLKCPAPTGGIHQGNQVFSLLITREGSATIIVLFLIDTTIKYAKHTFQDILNFCKAFILRKQMKLTKALRMR